MELTKDVIVENVDRINNLIDLHISEPNKTAIKTVLDGEVGELFFTSPASSKTKYHLAVPGGLAQHCLNVYDAFVKLNAAFSCGFSDENMFLCSLLHDFGKICTPDMKSPHYKVQESEWHRARGEPYVSDYSKGYFTNRDRTSFLLQSIGVKLTCEQFHAILIADGWFGAQNASYNNENPKFSLFMHFADFIAAAVLEKQE